MQFIQSFTARFLSFFQFLLMQISQRPPFVLVVQQRLELMVYKYTFLSWNYIGVAFIVDCPNCVWSLCRFGDPTAFGGHFEASAPGCLRPVSGKTTEWCLISGTNEYIFFWRLLLIIHFWISANVPPQAAVMDLVDSDKQRCLAVPVWDTYTQLLSQAGCQVKQSVHPLIK